MDFRGIVWAPNYKFDKFGQASLSSNIDDLKYCLLYWDKIDYPVTNIVNHVTDMESDINLLTDENILLRSKVVFKKKR